MSLPTKPTCRCQKKTVNKLPQFLYTLPLLGSLIPSLSHPSPRQLPSLLPELGAKISFAPSAAFAEQVPLRFGAPGAGEMGRGCQEGIFFGGNFVYITRNMVNPNKMEVTGSDDFPCSVGWNFRFHVNFQGCMVKWCLIWCVYMLAWFVNNYFLLVGGYISNIVDVPCFVRFVMVQ